MNCIIIDDKANGNQLENLVARCTSLQLVGTFNDPVAALNCLLKKTNIDLVFVDIEMAGIESINLFNSLSCPPSVIAVSSDGKEALNAYEHSCVDYLVKPITFSRFYRAVEKTIRHNPQIEINDAQEPELFIKDNISLVKLNAKDITYIEALKNNIIVNTIDRQYTLYFTLKGFENQLPPGIFSRIHKSYVVNKGLIRMVNGDHLQIVHGDGLKTLPVGKIFRKKILQDMHVINK